MRSAVNRLRCRNCAANLWCWSGIISAAPLCRSTTTLATCNLYSAKRRPAFGVLGADAEGYLQRHPEAARGAPIDSKGVYVGKVRPGSIAERAGIQPGDIITAFAGKRVNGTYALDKLIDMFQVGQSASARLLRDGECITVQIDFVAPEA